MFNEQDNHNSKTRLCEEYNIKNKSNQQNIGCNIAQGRFGKWRLLVWVFFRKVITMGIRRLCFALSWRQKSWNRSFKACFCMDSIFVDPTWCIAIIAQYSVPVSWWRCFYLVGAPGYPGVALVPGTGYHTLSSGTGAGELLAQAEISKSFFVQGLLSTDREFRAF